jgi:hypothetical protein
MDSLFAGAPTADPNCPFAVLEYFWWDCVTAQDEGGGWWDTHFGSNPNAWQDYGWRAGDGSATTSASHHGSPTQGSQDSNHWNWDAIIIYMICKDGHLHADFKQANNYAQFTWNQKTSSWDGSALPPLH